MNRSKKLTSEYLCYMYKYYLKCRNLEDNNPINIKDINFLKWLKEQINLLNNYKSSLNIESTDKIIEINTGKYNTLENTYPHIDIISTYARTISKNYDNSDITNLKDNKIILLDEPSLLILNNSYDEKLINQLLEIEEVYNKRIAIGFYGSTLDSNVESNMLKIMQLHKKMNPMHQLTFKEKNNCYCVISQSKTSYKNYYRKK